MNVWTDIQAIFNNREIALILWIAVIVLAVLFSKLRKSLVPIIKILTSKMFLIIFSLIGIYLFGIIFLFKHLDVWQNSNLKDVLFWLFTVGLILVFKINDAKSNAYFKGIFLTAIKWTIVLEFVVNKCARNAGRASNAINLTTLIMIGYFGLKQIYSDDSKKDTFRILITLFAFNHLIHFFFVFQNFKTHAMELNISENKHGFVTFIFIILMPVILWTFKNLNKVLYFCIILHLFNVSYFIMDTLNNKIKPDIITFHYKFGIFATIIALLYILYRVVRENKLSPLSNVNKQRQSK